MAKKGHVRKIMDEEEQELLLPIPEDKIMIPDLQEEDQENVLMRYNLPMQTISFTVKYPLSWIQ